MTSPYRRAMDLLPKKYVNNWFSAEAFFNTKSTSGVLRNNYFLTHDYFLKCDIHALRYINADNQCIDTLKIGTKEECKKALTKHLLTGDRNAL